MKIVLASGSPRRAKILASLGVDFEIVKTDAPEVCHPADPERTVRENALAKGAAVKGGHVLSADTIVWFGNRIYGKPRDLDEARTFLRELSGRTHTVFTGVAFDGRVEVVRSFVTFRTLSEEAIEDYVTRVKPVDRAGAYDIDESGDRIVASWQGSYENIMGLPVEPLIAWGIAGNKERNGKMNEELCRKAVEGLKARGFEAVYAATREAAAALVMKEAEAASSVGWGGSESIKEIGVRDRLAASGKEIRDHRLDMDLFLLSANALTVDGRIVNIDGRGNRVAASIAGPKRVVYVIGRNKIVEGGIDAAIARIKAKACPPNCRRLGKQTPCALTGVCADCDSPDRICKVTAIFDRKPTGVSALAIIVGETLGY